MDNLTYEQNFTPIVDKLSKLLYKNANKHYKFLENMNFL